MQGDAVIVLGIDPGPKLCGWALLDLCGRCVPTWKNGGVNATGDVLDWCSANWTPELVVIERPVALHRAQANNSVIDTAFASGYAFGLLAECFHCVTVSPPQVRASLIGVAKRGNQDAALKRLLERLVIGAPKRWNCHMRDAAAAAIVGHRMFQRRAA